MALVAAANAAPSADNRHPFYILQQGDRTLQLRATEAFSGGVPHRKTLSLIAIGAATENLVRRGARLGLRLEPRWADALAAERAGDLVAELHVGQSAPLADDALEQAIERRHSNRRLRYTGPALTEPQRAEMDRLQLAGTVLAWLDAPEPRRRALRLLRLAETERFRRRDLHRELGESIRFDIGWQRSAEIGLPLASLELPWIERAGFAAMMRHWPLQRAANLVGAHRFIGWRAADLPCRMAPHLVAIGTRVPGPQGVLDAGRLLQRIWLQAAASGLAVQVFAASPLYARSESRAVDAELQARLAAGWSDLLGQATPVTVLRLGRAAAPTVRTLRPDPARLLDGAAPRP